MATPIVTVFVKLALTTDVVATYSFGECWNHLDHPDFRAGWQDLNTGLVKTSVYTYGLAVLVNESCTSEGRKVVGSQYEDDVWFRKCVSIPLWNGTGDRG